MVLYMLYRKDSNTNGNGNERERQSSEMTNVGTSSRRTDLTDIAEIVEEEDETQMEALELGSTVTAEAGPTLTEPIHLQQHPIYIIHPSSASPPPPHMLSVSVWPHNQSYNKVVSLICTVQCIHGKKKQNCSIGKSGELQHYKLCVSCHSKLENLPTIIVELY